MLSHHHKGKLPIDFQGHGSEVKAKKNFGRNTWLTIEASITKLCKLFIIHIKDKVLIRVKVIGLESMWQGESLLL